MEIKRNPVGEVVANGRGGFDIRFYQNREIVPGTRFLLVPAAPQYSNIPLVEEVKSDHK